MLLTYVAMIFTVVMGKIKSFVLFLVTLFRRALCCFRRRRRYSCEMEPLTDVGVVSNEAVGEVETWSEWGGNNFNDRSPNSIQEHIELYRQQKALQQAKEESLEEHTDFFENMAPKITKQKKILVGAGSAAAECESNLSLVPDPNLVAKELGEWEENTGWEGETLDWDAQEALKEKKRQEREMRALEQQQRRLERSSKPLNTTVKIGT